ncbi:MAG TPA: 30S ribosomal protein S20 [bacterium]|nr:30S ribosomal protein S20 [bacterium]
MPNVKSAEKRLRQNEKRRERNRNAKAKMRTVVKKATKEVAGGDASAAKAAVSEACKTLDKTAQKGIIHKKTAARKKSRLMKSMNSKKA